MKNLFEQYKWLRIIFGIILFILGLVTLVVALSNHGTALTEIICVIVAIYCFINAIFIGVFSLILEKKVGFNGISGNLLISGVIAGVGIAFCFVDKTSSIIETVIQYCLPLILIASGGAILIKFLILITNPESRKDTPSWVRALVAWIIILTIGIVFLIKENSITDFIYIIIGSLIMVLGVLVVVSAIISLVRDHKIKKIESK